MSVQDFEAAVSDVEKKILDALYQRWVINVNKESGVARWPAMDDYINPCVSVSRDEIKELAGRDKLRNVFVEKLHENLASRERIVVEASNGGLRVCIAPGRAKENEFPTLQSLQKQNRADIQDDPEVANDPF